MTAITTDKQKIESLQRQVNLLNKRIKNIEDTIVKTLSLLSGEPD